MTSKMNLKKISSALLVGAMALGMTFSGFAAKNVNAEETEQPQQYHWYVKDGKLFVNDWQNIGEWVAKEGMWSGGDFHIENDIKCGIGAVEIVNPVQPTSLKDTFKDFKSIQTVDLSKIDSSKVEDMTGMFYNSNIQSIDISCLNTSNVKQMDYAFAYCKNLRNFKFNNMPFSRLDLSNLESMEHLFDQSSSIESIDLSYINAPKLTYFESAFQGCDSLKSASVAYGDLSSLSDISYLFKDCKSLYFGAINTTGLVKKEGAQDTEAMNEGNDSRFNESVVLY